MTNIGAAQLRADGKPFRWNMSNPKLIGRLKSGESIPIPEHDQDRLLRCGADALRLVDGDLVFVGRSLESLFDMLSGALAKTTWYDRLQILQVSLKNHESVETIRAEIERRNAKWKFYKPKTPEKRLDSFQSYLQTLRLLPSQILNRPRPIVFVDVVAKGTTYGTLIELLKFYCDDETNWSDVLSRLRWVAVQPDQKGVVDPIWKPSDSPWTNDIEPSHIKQIVINHNLWFYLTDTQFKTTYAYQPRSWGSDMKSHEWESDLIAARSAREIYRKGERSRRRLAALLNESPEPIDPVKDLARQLRREERNW